MAMEKNHPMSFVFNFDIYLMKSDGKHSIKIIKQWTHLIHHAESCSQVTKDLVNKQDFAVIPASIACFRL